MSSSRVRTSSGLTADGHQGPTQYGAAASTSSLPPITPRPRAKRRSAVPLSGKQLDKMTRQIMQVQKTSHERGIPLESEENSIGRLELLSSLHLNANADSDAAVALGSADTVQASGVHQRNDGLDRLATLQAENFTTVRHTEEWLQRMRSLQGEFPGSSNPSVAAASAARRGMHQAANDSFVGEGSFLLNPLGRRVVQQTSQPRTQHFVSRNAEATSDHDAPASRTRDARPKAAPAIELSGMTVEVQELMMIEDLLYVLMGIEGQYIRFARGIEVDNPASQLRGTTFIVDNALDASLRELVLRVLPLATCYSSLAAFVDLESTLLHGTIMHALCAAIRDLLKDHEELLVRLEHQMDTSPTFTLQKLWLLLQPNLRTFSLIYSFISDIAAISHPEDFESEEEGEDSDEDSDDEDQAMREAQEEMEAERRRLFGLNGLEVGHEDGGTSTSESDLVKGGEVLSMLWDRAEKQSGDPDASELFLRLFHRAAQPYARMLIQWISTGILSDSYDEFMVSENTRMTYDSLKTDPTDIYWEQRYTLRDQNILAARERGRQGMSEAEYEERGREDEDLIAAGRGLFTGGASIPSFLEPWKQKILLAGKYLNVVRECGFDVRSSENAASRTPSQDDDYSRSGKAETDLMVMSDPAFLERIDDAYRHANAQLLDLLLNHYNLIDRLRSLKHYFFFSSSDFFASFFEQADRELRKLVNPTHVRDSVKTRLQTHLGMVLGSSAVVGFSDPYKDDVRVTTALDNPYESLKRIANTRGVKGGDAAEAIALKAKIKARERDYTAVLLDVLEFDVTVKFPVSLVISRKNMIRWKFLHTILIQLKVTERQLADVWLEQQSKQWQSRASDHPELEGWKMRVFALRHRMTFFVQNVLAFFTAEVIEPNWASLERKIMAAKTVDQFLRDHTDFLNECRKECMLTDVRFVEFLQRLMTCARTFYDNRSRLDDHVLMTLSTWRAAKLDGESQPSELGAEMWRALEKQESKWTRSLKGFNSTVQLLATTDNPSALPLAMRLQSG